MPNYYEILNVAPTATVAEIEIAYAALYNQWRRLVTHHEPSVVEQANQAIRALEAIRAALADPEKRSIYDSGLGISGSTGGLADPTAILHPGAPVAPPPPRGAAPGSASRSSSPWACVKCGSDNPVGTKFCLTCGNQLVRACPQCRSMTSMVSTGFCGECGFRYDEAVGREQARQATEQERTELVNEIELSRNNLGMLQQALHGAQLSWGYADDKQIRGDIERISAQIQATQQQLDALEQRYMELGR